MSQKESIDYKYFILNGGRILDVRSEGEFEQGHIPGSVNVPILNDDDRKLVGTCHKKEGSDKAVALGYKLVSGEKKECILKQWKEEIDRAKCEGIELYLMCARGGMRSQIAKEWIQDELGVDLPRFSRGYKYFRQFLIDELEKRDFTPIILSGNTGTGKTVLLNKLANAIDLEGLAQHRGSAFGGRLTPQPSQANFENLLAFEMVKLKEQKPRCIIFESESRGIGRVEIPKLFFEHMHSGDYIFLENSMEKRVRFTYDDYVTKDLAEYTAFYGTEKGTELWRDNLRLKINKISRKLGAERTEKCLALFDRATDEGNLELHKEWIEFLLTNYYDPMYEHHRGNWCQKVVKTGTMEELYQYFTEELN